MASLLAGAARTGEIEAMPSRADLRAAVDAIRTWSRGDQRAPHKPLLLLMALSRVQHGEPRLLAFADAEAPLKQLLIEFGRTENYQPELPFWWLQTDGLWEIPGGELLTRRKGSTAPTRTALRTASGGLPSEIDGALRDDPELVRELAHAVLDAHFPPSIHENILSAVDLDLEPPRVTSERRARDRGFRELVLRAYGYQCAVCGLDTRLDGSAIGLEAAHLHWHAHRGPDVVENGLCLCPLHHKALDLGLLTVSERREVVVSSRLHGGEVVEAHIGRFHRRALIGPLHGQPSVDLRFARWHRDQVFKAPGRAA